MKWILGDIHEIYGEVVAMACFQGEPYRFFQKDNITTMIPLDFLKELGEQP